MLTTGAVTGGRVRRHGDRTSTTPSNPGMVLTAAALAISLLSILSPIAWMACVSGPMKATPAAAWRPQNKRLSIKSALNFIYMECFLRRKYYILNLFLNGKTRVMG